MIECGMSMSSDKSTTATVQACGILTTTIQEQTDDDQSMRDYMRETTEMYLDHIEDSD